MPNNIIAYLLFGVLMVSLGYNGVQRYQSFKAIAQYKACEVSLLSANTSIKAAQDEGLAQQKALKEREHEARKMRHASRKKERSIMSRRFPVNCEEAIKEGILSIHQGQDHT